MFEDLCRFNEVVGGFVQGEAADGRLPWDDGDGLAGPLEDAQRRATDQSAITSCPPGRLGSDPDHRPGWDLRPYLVRAWRGVMVLGFERQRVYQKAHSEVARTRVRSPIGSSLRAIAGGEIPP